MTRSLASAALVAACAAGTLSSLLVIASPPAASRTPAQAHTTAASTAAAAAPGPSTAAGPPSGARPVRPADPSPIAPAPRLDPASLALVPEGGVLVELTPADGATVRGWVLRDGRWRGPALAPGAYAVSARARGRAVSGPERLLIANAAAPLPLELRARAALRVRVRERQSGRPLPSARVEVWPAGSDPAARRALELRAGLFQLDDLPPGRFALQVSAEGHLAPALEVIELSRVEESLTVELDPGAWAEGLVLGPQGPLAGARVSAGGEEDQALVTAESDARGRFTLGPLLPGPHPLRIEAPGHAPLFVRGWRVEPGRGTPPLELRLIAGAALSGEVLDPDGRPCAAARVSALVAGPGGLQSLREADCDAEGRFSLASLPPGPLRVLARAPGCASRAPLTVELPAAGLPGLRLTLVRGGALTTQVVDERERPVPGATLELSGWEGPVARAIADADGRLALSGLPPSPLQARLCGPDASWLAVEWALDPDAGAGGLTAPARWVLRRAARLEGRVRAGRDTPPPEGTVVELTGVGLLVTLPVDASGAWRAEGLEPGEYTARARLFDVEASAPETFGLAVGASQRVPDLHLE